MFRFNKPKPRIMTGATVELQAEHRMPPHHDGEFHEHIWRITVLTYNHTDAEHLRTALREYLDPLQGKKLPDRLSSGEALAADVGRGLSLYDPAEVRVEREGWVAIWLMA